VVWSALQAKTLVGVSAGEGPNRGHPCVRGRFWGGYGVEFCCVSYRE